MNDSRPPTTPVKRRGPKGRIDSPGFLTLVVQLQKDGATKEEACEALKISPATYYRALNRIEGIKREAMRRNRP